MGAAEYDTAWRVALVSAAAATAFVAAVALLRPRGRPLGAFVLVAAGVFWPIFAADMLPLVWAAFQADPGGSTGVTVALYVLTFAAAVLLASQGHGRAVLAAGAGLIIRWALSLLFADIYSVVTR